MYGTPAGAQVFAHEWQHDALRDAQERRRHHRDTDFERQLLAQEIGQLRLRVVALAATVVAAAVAVAVI